MAFRPLFVLALIAVPPVFSMQIATTLYEDLPAASLVTAGTIASARMVEDTPTFELVVDRVFRGEAPSPLVVLTSRPQKPGLTTADGDPSFQQGEEVLVLLTPWLDGPASVGPPRYRTIRKIALSTIVAKDRFLKDTKSLIALLDQTDTTEKETVLLHLLSSEYDLILESAVKELGRLHSYKAVASLGTLLHASNPEVRFQVVDALREIGGEPAIRAILSALNDGSPRVRARAASSLGWIQARQAEDPLLVMLQSDREEESVRVNAALALARMHSTKAQPVFRALSADPATGPVLRSTLAHLAQVE